MPRPLRDQQPGYFHLGTRGNNRGDIYRTTDDRLVFLALLNRIIGLREWALLGWCLMTNHYHLVLETRHANLSAGMQRLNGVYAQWFNAFYSQTGHVFERRFWSKRIEDEEQLRDTVAYVIHNPVRAGICASPWDWRWVGAPLLGPRPAPGTNPDLY
jgi:putative transposase